MRSKSETPLPSSSSKEALPRTAGNLLHELQMRQIELETQNEELRRSKAALEESRDRYIEFYEFAPVGYLTLSETGQISEINYTGATLLGVERDKLIRRHLSNFVSPEDRVCWNRYFMDTLSRDSKLTCELIFRSGEGTNIHVQLDAQRLIKDGDAPVVRMVLTDISKSKQFENALREQEVFFGMIADNTDDYIAVLDLKGRRLYNSPSYCQTFWKRRTTDRH